MARTKLDGDEDFGLEPFWKLESDDPIERRQIEEFGTRWTDTAELAQDLASFLVESCPSMGRIRVGRIEKDPTVITLEIEGLALFQAEIKLKELL